MYNIKLLDNISVCGTERFPQELYKVNKDIDNPTAIMVRSSSMHEYGIPESVIAVARAGAGTNNIPLDKYAEKGIVVFNTPGANANAVKELTACGLLLSARKIYPAMNWVQTLKGEEKVTPVIEKNKSKFTGPELKGKKLGVIGLGAIGIQVANLASNFGMVVYGYDPFLSVDMAWSISRSIKHAKTLNEIYKECDFITLHVPMTKDTKEMINSQSIAAMKDGVRILNFSRGELVDSADIIQALDEKKVYCYVTDFPSGEMIGHPGVLALPHLGASTPESEENCAKMAADEIREYVENGNIVNSVNFPNVHLDFTGKNRISVIHLNNQGLISNISGAIGNNIDSFTNKSKGDIAYSVLDVDCEVTGEMIDNINKIDGVIKVRVIKPH